MNALVDLWKVKGLIVKDPYIPLCVPISVENPALAYDDVNDRFYVDISAVSYGSLPFTLADSWTRVLGQIDLARFLGSVVSHTNPLIVRLSNGTTWIDPRYILGNQDQTLRQRTGTYELLVQLMNGGVEIDPRAIRALTASDVVSAVQSGTWTTARSWNLGASDVPDLSDRAARLLGKVYGSQDVLQQRATSKELIVQIQHQGTEKDPTQIRPLTTSDKITPEQTDETKLKATVTQAAKDRTISSVDATATPVQINIDALNGNSSALVTPASGKKIRVKFISLEHSAAVDIGYRFGAAGTIYYLRIAAGVYVSNLIGCNNEGAADAALYLNSSGATNVKGYILYSEV